MPSENSDTFVSLPAFNKFSVSSIALYKGSCSLENMSKHIYVLHHDGDELGELDSDKVPEKDPQLVLQQLVDEYITGPARFDYGFRVEYDVDGVCNVLLYNCEDVGKVLLTTDFATLGPYWSEPIKVLRVLVSDWFKTRADYLYYSVRPVAKANKH